MALSTGSLLAGRYEITAPIAVGGMGEVWKARDRVLDRIVAAKVLKSEFTGDPSFLARFRNEARHTAALTHPNIASVFDYGETVGDGGTQLAFLVMEFVEGQPLVTILHEQGALPVDWTLHVLSQSADGLSAAHRAGVVHRDIKPGNLMVRPDGVVKLTDFGIAQARDATPLTRTGMVVGTAQYLSPEQAQGMEVTAASDVYSLGVVAYECLTGARPFDGASQVAIALAHINRPPPPLPGNVPPAVRLLVERALAKNPADRFSDGGAFAEAIRRVAAGGALTPGAGPSTTPTRIVAADGLTDSRTQVIPATGPAATAATAGAAQGPGGPMPPLQAPPQDDDWYGPAQPAEGRSRSRRAWAWLAAALVLVLLLAGGAWQLLGGTGDDGGTAGDTTAPASSSSAAPAGLLLDPALFVGRPVDEVEAELEEAELVVVRAEAGNDLLDNDDVDLEAGDVAGLKPSGEVAAPGTEVTLYVVPEAEVEVPQEPEESEEPAETTSATPTTSAPSETATTSTSTSASVSSTTATTASSPVLPAESEPPTGGNDGEGEGEGVGQGEGGGNADGSLPPVGNGAAAPGGAE
jgi:serine/threonine-protein kinase